MTQVGSGHTPFSQDTTNRGGYLYTGSRAPLSASTANLHLTAYTYRWLRKQPRTKFVLDLGCGDGEYTAQLALLLPKKVFVGIEPSALAISQAQKNYAGTRFLIGDLMVASSLPQTQFDASILRGVIHHVPNQLTCMVNAIKVSKKCLIIEPNGWNPVLKIIEKISPYHQAHQEQSFTSWQLKNWIKKAGGRCTTVHYVGLVPFFCPTVLVPILKFLEPYIEKSPVSWMCCAQVVIEVESL